jgi:hypothetical protein
MAEFRFLPVPAEDYEAWKAAGHFPGFTADTVLQTSLGERGDLVFHIVADEELESFVCNGDCGSCPVADMMGSPQNEVLWGEEERQSGRIPPIYRRRSLAKSATTRRRANATLAGAVFDLLDANGQQVERQYGNRPARKGLRAA